MNDEQLRRMIDEIEGEMPRAWRLDEDDDGRRCEELNRELLAYRREKNNRKLTEAQ